MELLTYVSVVYHENAHWNGATQIVMAFDNPHKATQWVEDQSNPKAYKIALVPFLKAAA